MIDPRAAPNWDPAGYQAHAGFVPALGSAVLDLLVPGRGMRVLDLGCGDGVLTGRIAATGAEVVGVDADPPMVAAARARGLDARVGDAAALGFVREFDAVFSNAALHWVKAADAAIAGVARALKPGGRFVAEFGGHGNVAAIVTALHAVLRRRGVDAAAAHPWFFPTVADYRGRLERHGFSVDAIALVPRPTPLPTDMAGWLDTFAQPFWSALAAAERAAAKAEAVALLAPALRDEAGGWTADYVRLRFAAKLA